MNALPAQIKLQMPPRRGATCTVIRIGAQVASGSKSSGFSDQVSMFVRGGVPRCGFPARGNALTCEILADALNAFTLARLSYSLSNQCVECSSGIKGFPP